MRIQAGFSSLMQEYSKPMLEFPASLWNGIRQLHGTLEIWETEVFFRLTDFKGSHLNLLIHFSDIQKVEEFLIYDIARNGLRIIGKDGKTDLFVLEDSQVVKQTLDKLLKNLFS